MKKRPYEESEIYTASGWYTIFPISIIAIILAIVYFFVQLVCALNSLLG